MASIQERGGRFQLRVARKPLTRPFFFTFDTREEAVSYGQQLEALLSRGIVPLELMEREAPRDDGPLLPALIRDYAKAFPVTASDEKLLYVVLHEVAGVRLAQVNARWVDGYVDRMKRERNLAPGTIRKRIGVLGRVVDWHLRHQGQSAVVNPFRILPAGYSAYSDEDASVVAPKRDQKRDRRLTAQEDARIRAALAGEKRPDRERALTIDPAFALLYSLIVDTGLRLFEAFRLRADMIDTHQWIINVPGSKGARGEVRPRVVPLKPSLRAPLRDWCAGRVGLLFPFWDGTEADRPKASGRLSARFSKLFEYAQVTDFTEHDLRHEATCRWFELRGAQGWVFSEVEVCRIMGWTDTRMALRYASLRGSDLSARLG